MLTKRLAVICINRCADKSLRRTLSVALGLPVNGLHARLSRA